MTLVNIGLLRGYRWHYLARIWRTPVLGEAVMRMGTLEDSGHWPMIDHPVAVEQPVLRFLNALTSGP